MYIVRLYKEDCRILWYVGLLGHSSPQYQEFVYVNKMAEIEKEEVESLDATLW